MQNKAHLFDETLVDLAAAAKALSHPARLEILRTLARRRTCICDDLTRELPLAQATVSQHLKVLKTAGLIQGEVDGPRVCYCADAGTLLDLRDRLAAFFEELDLETLSDCC
jgi:DNA-binding transcriptional ArsR family regulator